MDIGFGRPNAGDLRTNALVVSRLLRSLTIVHRKRSGAALGQSQPAAGFFVTHFAHRRRSARRRHRRDRANSGWFSVVHRRMARSWTASTEELSHFDKCRGAKRCRRSRTGTSGSAPPRVMNSAYPPSSLGQFAFSAADIPPTWTRATRSIVTALHSRAAAG